MDEVEIAPVESYDELTVAEQIKGMTDRELLESIALDIHSVKLYAAAAVEAVEPLLKDPKVKLLFKMFG